MSDQWGRTVGDAWCQGREERQLCSPPRVAAGLGRESPSAGLGVLQCCIGIWECKSFGWVIRAMVAESPDCVGKLKRSNSHAS